MSPSSRTAPRPAVASRPARRWAKFTARTLSSLVLASLLSLMVVIADRLVYVWSDGHLVVAILVLWGVLFAGLALLSGTVQHWSERLAGIFHQVSQRVAQGQLEMQMLEQARQDPRAMADLRAARASDEPPDNGPVHDEPANGQPPRDPSDMR